MARWRNFYLDGHAHLVTGTVRDWRPLLKGEAVEVLYREWSTARARLCVRVLAYVVMPEHFHAILWAECGHEPAAQTMLCHALMAMPCALECPVCARLAPWLQ